MFIPRPMKYLSAEIGNFQIPGQEPFTAVALNFDNAAGRNDDLITIVITPDEAGALMEQLQKLITPEET